MRNEIQGNFKIIHKRFKLEQSAHELRSKYKKIIPYYDEIT